MHYRDDDDVYFEIVEAHGSSLFTSFIRTEYPYTYRAMRGFFDKTNNPKTAILDSTDSNNLKLDCIKSGQLVNFPGFLST